MQHYFEIENLKCSYDQRRVVLEIDKLAIPRGKVVFIVGPSGCGKSTILETLGLMNNTLFNDYDKTLNNLVMSSNGAEPLAPKFLFFPSDSEQIDCMEAWKQKNEFISSIRRKYFSFIFQQTNLMKNFSIRQNSVIPQLLKGGDKRYEDVLRRVGLNQILDEQKENVGELSGGQQQRLAFVRAILPNFQIIFGDEPTGNLDPENADNLMKIIYDEIHNPPSLAEREPEGEAKSAIIVSHTPELYNKYADIIISIHKRQRANGDSYGVIDETSVKINQ